MELRDVEICLGIQFPELFHTINNSGMMDYLRHSREWIEDKIANDMNYVWRGDFLEVGYINIYPNSAWGAFGGKGYPEIVDFGVLEKYRNRGIGTVLMDIAEKIAATYADIVYLGVGLHSGYGSAQRMYVKRGYVPDGSGVWYQDKICKPYEECKNDDDLVLYFSKKL